MGWAEYGLDWPYTGLTMGLAGHWMDCRWDGLALGGLEMGWAGHGLGYAMGWNELVICQAGHGLVWDGCGPV
jgi:hypothetical protein